MSGPLKTFQISESGDESAVSDAKACPSSEKTQNSQARIVDKNRQLENFETRGTADEHRDADSVQSESNSSRREDHGRAIQARRQMKQGQRPGRDGEAIARSGEVQNRERPTRNPQRKLYTKPKPSPHHITKRRFYKAKKCRDHPTPRTSRVVVRSIYVKGRMATFL